MYYIDYIFTKYNKYTIHIIYSIKVGGKNRKLEKYFLILLVLLAFI